MRYLITDIYWDTDNDDVFLPTSMEVNAESAIDAIDVATDITGYCIFGCSSVEEIV